MKIPATVSNRSGDFFLQIAQTKGKVAELITYLTKTKGNFSSRPNPLFVIMRLVKSSLLVVQTKIIQVCNTITIYIGKLYDTIWSMLSY